uniref:Uncharacterized protein n=1 Tax=Palpitomonas bilix TaxID=652834 RepID=A0A7S3GHP1_9EUKA|mmetsp:Transcript_49897/g.128397  ORF Transcript_49897/g.128397 Transcript_49897/m.128397 type:complete len:131 (+) Transcript_49897:139-531(+)
MGRANSIGRKGGVRSLKVGSVANTEKIGKKSISMAKKPSKRDQEKARRSAKALAEREGLNKITAEEILLQRQTKSKKNKNLLLKPVGLQDGKKQGAVRMLSALARESSRVASKKEKTDSAEALSTAFNAL